VRAQIRSAAARAGLKPGGEGRNGSGARIGPLFGRPAKDISRTQARCLLTARQGMLMVAYLAGDLAEAGRGETGPALRHRDMGTGDGVQVEVPVQGAETRSGYRESAGLPG